MNNIKLQNKIFSLPNKDKEGNWVETYDEKIHGLNRMVAPFRALFCSRPNGGKSTVMVNCFLQIQAGGTPFEVVIVVQPSSSMEWDFIDPTMIVNDIPDIESIVDEDHKKTLIIFDDFELTKLNSLQQQRINILFRYGSSHMGISVMLSYQSFFSIPSIIRKCCNYFYIWRTQNIDEINIISKRCGFNKKVFQKLFKKYIIDKHDFLLIDTVRDDIRKNIYEIIPKEEYNEF